MSLPLAAGAARGLAALAALQLIGDMVIERYLGHRLPCLSHKTAVRIWLSNGGACSSKHALLRATTKVVLGAVAAGRSDLEAAYSLHQLLAPGMTIKQGSPSGQQGRRWGKTAGSLYSRSRMGAGEAILLVCEAPQVSVELHAVEEGTRRAAGDQGAETRSAATVTASLRQCGDCHAGTGDEEERVHAKSVPSPTSALSTLLADESSRRYFLCA